MRDKPLMTYLIVNICIDLGKPEAINKKSVLRPYAMMILALHWGHVRAQDALIMEMAINIDEDADSLTRSHSPDRRKLNES